jgi:hypothetical protein
MSKVKNRLVYVWMYKYMGVWRYGDMEIWRYGGMDILRDANDDTFMRCEKRRNQPRLVLSSWERKRDDMWKTKATWLMPHTLTSNTVGFGFYLFCVVMVAVVVVAVV